MIRGGSRRGRVGPVAACVVAAIALGAPAAASGQGAVDEYTLDLPEGGGAGPVDANNPPPPTTGATSSATGGGSGTEAEPGTAAGTGAGAQDPKAGGPKGKPQPAISFAPFHDGVQPQSLDTTSRSAPEIVADALLDGAMLPILAALALITAAGAWRVLRSRRTLTGQAG
jgi:hypothetical protein